MNSDRLPSKSCLRGPNHEYNTTRRVHFSQSTVFPQQQSQKQQQNPPPTPPSFFQDQNSLAYQQAKLQQDQMKTDLQYIKQCQYILQNNLTDCDLFGGEKDQYQSHDHCNNQYQFNSYNSGLANDDFKWQPQQTNTHQDYLYHNNNGHGGQPDIEQTSQYNFNQASPSNYYSQAPYGYFNHQFPLSYSQQQNQFPHNFNPKTSNQHPMQQMLPNATLYYTGNYANFRGGDGRGGKAGQGSGKGGNGIGGQVNLFNIDTGYNSNAKYN